MWWTHLVWPSTTPYPMICGKVSCRCSQLQHHTAYLGFGKASAREKVSKSGLTSNALARDAHNAMSLHQTPVSHFRSNIRDGLIGIDGAAVTWTKSGSPFMPR